MKKIYTSIDIGSDTIKFLIVEEINGSFYTLYSTVVKTKGIRKGLVVDSNLLVNSVKDGIKKIYDELGIMIKETLINVPEYNVKFTYVTSKIKIANKVTSDDVSKIIKTSVYNKIDKDYELVTVIPIEFTIDEQENIKYPIGISGKELELKGIMMCVPKKNIYSVISALEAAGLKVIDIVPSGIADYHQIRNTKLDNLLGAIINIGHETTNVSIISQGKLVNTEVIQLGGINIENDIAYVFGTNIVDARKIKERFATCHKRFTNLNDTYELKNNIGENIKLNQLEVTEVVMSRITEILNYAKKQIQLLTKKELDYIIITGGLTEMKSFKNLVYDFLGKDVIIYSMDEIGIRDNKYTSVIGMIKYYHDKMKIRGKSSSMISSSDEQILLTPDNKKRKEKAVVSKMFKGFIKNKEEK